MNQNSKTPQSSSIPEESGPMYSLYDEVEYVLDLGSGSGELSGSSGSTTPIIVRPRARRPVSVPPRPARSAPSPHLKAAQRDCGICFELAVAPVRTLCCATLFCAEHIAAWLHGPQSDGRCPSCRAPASIDARIGLLALGHPSEAHLIPKTPPPSRAPSPVISECSSSSAYSSDSYASDSTASYSAYPSTPAALPKGNYALSEEEDATDYSLPALLRARALQTRRHTPHPISSVLGLRAALSTVARGAGLVIIVAILAGRGGWGAAPE
ncbi:hypothetical protein C8J57DRAFT_336167 [Mycena rebaudengoi]|nr:hypothetical protein C8J57DRAFT_336167 [Mycena rebaudengoi]